MTKRNNKDKKPTVKSDRDNPKKNNIVLFVLNKNKVNKTNDKKSEDEKLNDKKSNDKKSNDEKSNDEKSQDEKSEDEKSNMNEEKSFIDESDDNIFNENESHETYEDKDETYEDDDETYEDDDETYEDEDESYEDESYEDEDEFYEDEDESYKDEDDTYEEEDLHEDKIFDDDDHIDKSKDNKSNLKNNKRKSTEDPMDDLFNVIIGGKGLFGPGPPPLGRRQLIFPRDPQEKQNKKIKKEKFHDYFKESKNLLPINKEINNLQDLIDLAETYDKKDKNRYVINMRALHKCLSSLKELNRFIGMKKIKEMILDLIFLRLQNIDDKSENEMWHLVVQGSPGCGKTEVSRVIGKLYYGLGIVDNKEFTQVKRSQLIGKFCGHTAVQTQEIFDKAEGGVIFIDEAYSLGNPEQKDSFTKECIDTINQNLTEKKNTVVIIAGYKEQLDESFFSYNPGLARRFKMRLSVDDYDYKELRQIYLKKLYENNWEVMNNDEEKEIPLEFFEKNRDIFKFNGGDMENLWSLTKVVHCRRIFGKDNNLTKKIIKKDVYNAFEKYKENEEVKNRTDDKHIKKYIQDTMYC